MSVTDPLVGSEMGPYLVEARLGAGGMGVVYRARNLALDRPVAMKVLPSQLIRDRAARARFQREIRTAVAVEHPNVVPVYDAGYEEGYFYIAMRLVEGPDLGVLLEEGALDRRRALRLFGQIASGLAYVHRRSLVHRDIKPQNILIAEAGTPGEYALLTDFGIARALDSSTGLTRGIIGTAEYIAPEVLQWQPARPASDQYALACVLYEMLVGESPYRGRELPAAHLHEPVPDVASAAPGVPGEVTRAIERALAKDPDARFASVEAFADAVGGAPIPAPGPVRPEVRVGPEVPVRPLDPPPQPLASTSGRRLPDLKLRRSWILWTLIPLLNFFAWVQAAIAARYVPYAHIAAAYGSLLVAVVVETEIRGTDEVSGPLSAVVIVVWIGGIVHGLAVRKDVDARIDARRGR